MSAWALRVNVKREAFLSGKATRLSLGETQIAVEHVKKADNLPSYSNFRPQIEALLPSLK